MARADRRLKMPGFADDLLAKQMLRINIIDCMAASAVQKKESKIFIVDSASVTGNVSYRTPWNEICS